MFFLGLFLVGVFGGIFSRGLFYLFRLVGLFVVFRVLRLIDSIVYFGGGGFWSGRGVKLLYL